METVSTGVLDKSKEHYLRSKDKADKSHDELRHKQLYKSKYYQKWRFAIHYVKPTAKLLFKSWFKNSGQTYRRQVVNPRHPTPQGQLEQLERLRSEDTSPPHDYPYYWPVHIGSQIKTRQSQSYKFEEFAKTSYFLIFWSCLIWCVNMKWIRRELLKIQSGHDSVHRRTDGRTDGQTRWNQYTPFNFVERGYNQLQSLKLPCKISKLSS